MIYTIPLIHYSLIIIKPFEFEILYIIVSDLYDEKTLEFGILYNLG
jgi:hypothetical protein